MKRKRNWVKEKSRWMWIIEHEEQAMFERIDNKYLKMLFCAQTKWNWEEKWMLSITLLDERETHTHVCISISDLSHWMMWKCMESIGFLFKNNENNFDGRKENKRLDDVYQHRETVMCNYLIHLRFFSLTQISIHNCHHVIRSFIWRCPLSVVICFVSGYRTLFSRLVYIVWCTRCRTLWHSPRQLNCQIHSVKWKLPLFGIPFGMQNSEKAFEANFTSYWILQADFPHIDWNNCHTTTKNAMWYYYLWSEKMLMVDERMENVLIFIRCRAQIVYMIFRVFSRCCCRCSIKVSFIFSNTSSSCQIECISTERASHTGYFSDEIDRQPDTETTWCGHFVWIFLQTRLDIQKRTSITKPFDGFCTKSPTKKSCNSRSRIDRRNGRISLIVCVPSAFGQCHPSAFAGHQRFRKCVIKNSCFDGTLLDVCIWWREC